MRRILLAAAVALSLAISSQAEDIPGNNIPDVIYSANTGQLSVSTDGAELISMLIVGPPALSIDRWIDGTTQDGVIGWEQEYFVDSEQWVGAGSGRWYSRWASPTTQMGTRLSGRRCPHKLLSRMPCWARVA